jgi:RNA polymerase sigma factor (sigma-70 family)
VNPPPGDSDDRELMRLHVAGDPDAFGELVRRHRDRLWAVALRTMGEPEEAADALQDALLSAFRRADSYRGEAAVTTWLHRVVVNACMDRYRRHKVRQTEPLPTAEDRMADLGIEPETDLAEALETRSTVLEALEHLTPEQRAAIVLVDMEGYSVHEAAAILECAEGTVKSRCARGRARLVPLLTTLRAGNQADGPNVSSTQLPSSPDRQGGATR